MLSEVILGALEGAQLLPQRTVAVLPPTYEICA